MPLVRTPWKCGPHHGGWRHSSRQNHLLVGRRCMGKGRSFLDHTAHGKAPFIGDKLQRVGAWCRCSGIERNRRAHPDGLGVMRPDASRKRKDAPCFPSGGSIRYSPPEMEGYTCHGRPMHRPCHTGPCHGVDIEQGADVQEVPVDVELLQGIDIDAEKPPLGGLHVIPPSSERTQPVASAVSAMSPPLKASLTARGACGVSGGIVPGRSSCSWSTGSRTPRQWPDRLGRRE